LAAGGCPVADTDQDGILDNFDKCPGVFGLAIFEGCPDTDGDGIEDAKDKCPDVFGDFDAQGCPLTEAPEELLTRFQSLSIFFGKDSYSIALEYYQDLQEVASFLEKYPDYFLTVNGFADSAEGKDRGRRWLAQKRAQSIAQFLRSEGVGTAQLQSKGMGVDRQSAIVDYRRRVDFVLEKRKVKP
ncbi:MAG: OmpA family protein, partial [Bacteroidota bacterium]